jgi:hypothetical protein
MMTFFRVDIPAPYEPDAMIGDERRDHEVNTEQHHRDRAGAALVQHAQADGGDEGRPDIEQVDIREELVDERRVLERRREDRQVGPASLPAASVTMVVNTSCSALMIAGVREIA